MNFSNNSGSKRSSLSKSTSISSACNSRLSKGIFVNSKTPITNSNCRVSSCFRCSNDKGNTSNSIKNVISRNSNSSNNPSSSNRRSSSRTNSSETSSNNNRSSRRSNSSSSNKSSIKVNQRSSNTSRTSSICRRNNSNNISSSNSSNININSSNIRHMLGSSHSRSRRSLHAA